MRQKTSRNLLFINTPTISCMGQRPVCLSSIGKKKAKLGIFCMIYAMLNAYSMYELDSNFATMFQLNQTEGPQ